MKKKTIFVFIIVFIFGIIIGGSGKKEAIETVEKESFEVEKNIVEWQQLKEIDDKGFELATESLSLCSQGFYAIADLDMTALNEITVQMEYIAPEISAVAKQRQVILESLGY